VKDVAKNYSILGSEFQRRAGWFITGTAFYGSLRAIKETASTVSEVEMGMIEIARIMEDETFVVKNFRDELLELGIAYGQTFDIVQDIAVKWAQAGYNAADTLELTKTALLALNTAELDATYATQGLIAIMAQWQLTAEELLPVLDKINKTADDYAVSSQDIIDGLNRTGAAAKNMNLSLEETIASTY
jgi:TP901 family phage tail tape measure protein